MQHPLENRKRLSELSTEKTQADLRKDELLAMKLEALNGLLKNLVNSSICQ